MRLREFSIPAIVGCTLALPVMAADVTVTVRGTADQPAADTVVLLYATDRAGSEHPPGSTAPRTIEQQGQMFAPAVSLVPVGTEVLFPNFDRMRHHVYSFSEAKPFEVRLYSGEETPSILFDRPGIVVLGCNIHDWMEAYLYVADTRYASLTGADGRAALADVPAGSYRLEIWRPGMEASQSVREVEIPPTAAADIDVDTAIPATQINQSRPQDDPLAALFEAAAGASD